MWARLYYYFYEHESSTYDNSYPADEKPVIDGFNIEYRECFIIETYRQEFKYTHSVQKKTIDGEVWKRSIEKKQLEKLPSEDIMKSWLNVHTQILEDGRSLYTYQRKVFDWFIEINTPEEIFDLEDQYGISLMGSSYVSRDIDWGDTIHKTICLYDKVPTIKLITKEVNKDVV